MFFSKIMISLASSTRHGLPLVEWVLSPYKELFDTIKVCVGLLCLWVIMPWWLLLWFVGKITCYDYWLFSFFERLCDAPSTRKASAQGGGFHARLRSGLLDTVSEMHGTFCNRDLTSFSGGQPRTLGLDLNVLAVIWTTNQQPERGLIMPGVRIFVRCSMHSSWWKHCQPRWEIFIYIICLYIIYHLMLLWIF